MTNSDKPRLLLIQAFSMPEGSTYSLRASSGPRKSMLMNYSFVEPLLADVDWQVHPGPTSHHGTSLVETREEFMMISAARLPLVREACESGKYDAVVLLGGGDPGFLEASEIGQRYGIPITACANAQMHIATTLGNKFTVIDVSEAHAMHYHSLIVAYGFGSRCASIRNINAPLSRDGHPGVDIRAEMQAVAAGKTSALLEAAVDQAEAAIDQDGAECFIIGCSALYWLRPHLERRLAENGWAAPVLEGYTCAIELAKLKLRLGLSVSGITFPLAPAPRFRQVIRA